MKKFFLLGITVLTIVSCERNSDMVDLPQEQELLINENLFKREADSTQYNLFNTTSGLESGIETEPSEGLDPKDITPPRR
ncbi:hypothetical protein AB670_02525 [Chryseobacterium sp. MOF25P]|uniref:hypothetical protein n=1 Tax=unclassified Chryseobacterium TaxID=2593645 RepID=UPI000805EECB|nr:MULTISPECIES: hypothetical protein [unclassified Chryseobacterium]MBO6185735.1 hypothetical protein [Chryseobacterium sp.]OBW41075.1 hypothetical protein AB670_02525 [Chryseobacterium sp. MOF25P]OBW45795.1 hypothetical protein AB671_02204 [Chryseobacterium sp. BGARF1]